MQIKEYQDAVNNFAEGKEDFEFTNKGKEHAAIVVAHLIRTAEKELLIYSGNLNKDVANDSYLIKVLNQFLEEGKKLRIIIDSMPNEENISEALKQVKNSINNPLRDVIIKEDIENKFADSIKSLFPDGKPHHFMVADGRAYRFEIDRAEYKAICNFNDPIIAVKLKSLIDQFFQEK